MRQIIIEVPENCEECSYMIPLSNDENNSCILFDKNYDCINHKPCKSCIDSEVNKDNV